MYPSQSVFGGMHCKKKKKNKRRRHSHHQSQTSQQILGSSNRVNKEPSTPESYAHDNGEIRFVLPLSKSKSAELMPFLFEKQLDQSALTYDTKVQTKLERNRNNQDREYESIDDILFSRKKKKAGPTDTPQSNNDNDANKTSKLTESVETSSRKINARTVQDALQDKIGRRPRANSTDGELNLPRHGLCDEHIILESHKWDILRLHNYNSLAVKNPPPPRGMVNLGNTCFLNATLQCLLYMPSFCHSITSLPASCYESNGGGRHVRGQKITMILRNLSRMAHGIAAMEKKETPKSKAIAPNSIVNAITKTKGSHSFRPGRQEDAHELLVHLLDAMHEGELFAAGINPHSSGWRDKLPIPRLDETTFVHRIFGGYFRSQLKCACGYKSNTYDPFLDLALEVSKKHIHSIETAFAEFTKKEKLDADNRWKCSGCNRHVCPTKHLSVFRPPLSLCIHLKRFDFGGMGFGRGGWGEGYGHRHGKGLGMMAGGGGSKINKPIQFPSELRLPLSDSRVCEYKLTGIIVHVGNSATSGHYTAFVKKPEENRTWYHMDDSFVEAVSEKTVLKQRDVYVLFYSRKEVKMEFPQPPREPMLKNASRSNATSAAVENDKDQKVDVPSDKCVVSTKKSGQVLNINASRRLIAHSLGQRIDPSPKSPCGENSSSPDTSPVIIPHSDTSAIKNAHHADDQSSSSNSSDSGSYNSEKNRLRYVKRSLEYAVEEQMPPSSDNKKKKNTVTMMKGNNVEVVLSRNKKRVWKPQDAVKINSEDANVLLGNRAVGGWDDDSDDEIVKKNKKSKNDTSLRVMASKILESADRSRKREMHLDKWDAALDEGRVRSFFL